MNWLDQLRIRFRRLRAIREDPRQRIGSCTVDLSGFPSERLILDVDNLIANDTFAGQIINRREQRCDLIVFFNNSGNPSITLIEAKGTRIEAFGDEFKAIEQLESSHRVMRRALGQCTLDLPELSINGAVVTGSSNSGALMQPNLHAITSTAEIDIKVVPSGSDVFDQLFGRYRRLN